MRQMVMGLNCRSLLAVHCAAAPFDSVSRQLCRSAAASMAQSSRPRLFKISPRRHVSGAVSQLLLKRRKSQHTYWSLGVMKRTPAWGIWQRTDWS